MSREAAGEALTPQSPLPRAGEGVAAVLAIRQATTDDAPDIAALFGETRRTSLPFLPTLHTPEEDRAYFGERV